MFDRVFGDAEPQETVWEYVAPGVEAFVQGYNVSVLAYGQSGAGKSYTMGTSSPAEVSGANDIGIVPRAAAVLFEKLGGRQSGIRPPKVPATPTSPSASAREEKSWQLKATYVEVSWIDFDEWC